MKIHRYKDLVTEAFKDIKKYQTGEKKIIKTNRPYIDDTFPLVNGGVVLVAANTGIGKSTELAVILNNVMDVNLNEDADKYVSLNISLEMRVLSLILRGLSTKISKSKMDIITKEFTDEEKILANEYFIALQDERHFFSQDRTTPKKFYEACHQFLTDHKDKETVFIGYDHLALTGADGTEARNTTIEHLMEMINLLKLEFENVVFILLSQTNSDNIKRAKDKDVMSQPQVSDIFYSQFATQISDYVVVITSPHKMGIKEYSRLNPERYPHLEKYFLEPDSKGRVSLETYGVNYYHLLKAREASNGFIDIYAEDLQIPELDKRRKEFKEDRKPTVVTPKFDSVVFNQTQTESPEKPLPTVSALEAFGSSSFSENNEPF